ncbi:YciI family protein [Actinokineospora sp. NBRC 105648]|uniref:YciI family protein n=1 Tax=Actinokineospora sp. NBRC 105648 TaxID=3032206 RepID=UPI00249FE9C3|nr:YciI family protein [Actinokineospora sp. NBRC 105648]GLZ40414.1 hypothetical protein Acsp05_40380 [Actinokineospora sp. NBRC 105648]
MPRYMMMHKMTADMEAGVPPTPEQMARIGALMAEVEAAGVQLAGEGLRPTKDASRIVVKDGATTVTDGPFAETKELIAGFSIVRTETREEAIGWALKFAEVLGHDIEIDVRQVVEFSDFE